MLIGLLVTSCGTKPPVALSPTITETTTTEVQEVDRDSVIKLPEAKSYYEAYLACLNGQVVVKDANIKRSENKALQPPSVNIDKDNKLTVDCTIEAQDLFLEWKEKFIKEYKVKEIKITVPVPIEMNSWQKFQIYLGRVFLGILVLGIGYGLYTKKLIR